MIIRLAVLEDILPIQELANQIWRDTYSNILPLAQIDLMLANMYSEDSLEKQMASGVKFIIVEEDENHSIGFASYSKKGSNPGIFLIHKLYILKSAQGKGVGSSLINYIKQDGKGEGVLNLELNVNRNNPAVSFYLKQGFKVLKEEDIPYHGYVLIDYVLSTAI